MEQNLERDNYMEENFSERVFNIEEISQKRIVHRNGFLGWK